MHKGTVLYLTDVMTFPQEEDDEKLLSSLNLDPEASIIAASAKGFYDLHDATRLLLYRGAKYVEAVKARSSASGSLEVFGEPMRLFG